MSLKIYVQQKYALQAAEAQAETDTKAREKWASHTFKEAKDQIIDLISRAFASSNFARQEENEKNTLNFFSGQIGETAKVTFRVHESIEAEIELNTFAIGSILINSEQRDGKFTFLFTPIDSDQRQLSEVNDFEEALDSLIDRFPEFSFIDV